MNGSSKKCIRRRTAEDRTGFSLTETMIAMGIAALLLMTGATPFLRSSPKYLLEKTVWEIRSRLHQARFRAILEGNKFRVSFTPDSYTLEKYDKVTQAWAPSEFQKTDGVLIQANNTPVFHPQGTVSNLASIVLSNRAGSWTITLAISGRIKAAAH